MHYGFDNKNCPIAAYEYDPISRKEFSKAFMLFEKQHLRVKL